MGAQTYIRKLISERQFVNKNRQKSFQLQHAVIENSLETTLTAEPPRGDFLLGSFCEKGALGQLPFGIMNISLVCFGLLCFNFGPTLLRIVQYSLQRLGA